MSEDFGHSYFNGPGIHIDSWGAGPFVIICDKKTFRFEDSDRFGPLFVGRDGEPLENQHVSARSPFWRAHMLWARQGRRTQDDGKVCVWDEPRPTIIKTILKGHAVIIEHGEDDGKYIEAVDGADTP